MEFYKACELAYKTFMDWDEPGINNIVDIGEFWIFESGKMGELSLGSLAFTIDKKNGEISWHVPAVAISKENILSVSKEFQAKIIDIS